MSISLFSIRDSGAVRDSGAILVILTPEPSLHLALGKLKSPIRTMSGVGLPRSRIVRFILSTMMFWKDRSRGAPWYRLLS